MTLEYRPITLDAGIGDCTAMLVLHEGALLAVATQLGELHGELAGKWFLEAVFHATTTTRRDPFPDIAALDTWLTAQLG